MPELRTRLSAPFRHDGRIVWSLVLLYAAIHTVALYNALRHDPGIGYDAESHLAYIETLSTFRLPSRQDTSEFFCPPAPYFLPAVARSLGLAAGPAARLGLILNVAFSMALCFFLLKICERLRPGAIEIRILALGLLGMLPVYYRSFAFIRGEPLLAAAAVFALHEAIAVLIDGERSAVRTLRLGLGLGLALLSRQWGILLLPAFCVMALILAFRRRKERAFLIGRAGAAVALALITGGWFYAHLHARFGTIRTFNRVAVPAWSLGNQPAHFYLDLGLARLFTDPVRDAFPNRLAPTFYSDIWGDYWGYFLVYGKDVRTGTLLSVYDLEKTLQAEPRPEWLRTNRDTMAAYLGRVNVVSLVPSAILAAGLALGMVGCARATAGTTGAPERSAAITGFLFLAVGFTLAGYFWFLLAYPSPLKGRTIKPTYVLQIFPFLCVLGGEVLLRVKGRSIRLYRSLLALLGGCAAHNLPALFTRSIG